MVFEFHFSEIGVLTANKVSSRQYKIVAPLNPEKPIKYVRKPIDYSILDDIGHGIQAANKQKHRGSSQVSQSFFYSGLNVWLIECHPQGSIQSINATNIVGPPPTTKPPTPPQLARGNTGTLGKSAGNTGTLGKGSREYRTPPVVVPPQVPSHYAPNYPRRSGSDRGSGYSALPGHPVPPSQQVATHQVHHNQTPVGMVHPLPPPPPANYDERNSMPRKCMI